MPPVDSLQRFLDAQAGRGQYSRATFEQALNELRAGQKQSCWAWYVFPQLAILGTRPAAKHYGIQNLKAACDYLKHPLLFKHYHEMLLAVQSQINTQKSLRDLMGPGDDFKFISSLTLFREAALRLSQMAPAEEAQFTQLALDANAIFEKLSPRYRPCERTLNHIAPEMLKQSAPVPVPPTVSPPVVVHQPVSPPVVLQPVSSPVVPQPVSRPAPVVPSQNKIKQSDRSDNTSNMGHGLLSLTLLGGGVTCVVLGAIHVNPILIVIGALMLSGFALHGAAMCGFFSKAAPSDSVKERPDPGYSSRV